MAVVGTGPLEMDILENINCTLNPPQCLDLYLYIMTPMKILPSNYYVFARIVNQATFFVTK